MPQRAIKTVCLVLALLCLLCLPVLAEEEPAADPQSIQLFPDLPPTHWCYPYVMPLVEAGVINGCSDGTYSPDREVTTGEALKAIILAAGYEEPEKAPSHWARGYLNFAIDQGFLTRFVDIVDLDVPMERGIVAKLTALALGLTREGTEQIFTDTNDDYAHALYEVGIITGYLDGTFRMNGHLLRSELAAILLRTYHYRFPPEPEEDPVQEPDGASEEEPELPEIILRTTEGCIDYLKRKEGFAEYPQWDYLQYSVGHGSRCEWGDYPDGITLEQADRLLRENLAKFEEELNAFLEKCSIDLTDAQYDAMMSFTYNAGTMWMYNTRLSNLMRSGRFTLNEFASAFCVWCHVTVGGKTEISESLLKRRYEELKIFFFEDYEGTESPDFRALFFTSDKGSIDTDVAVYLEGTAYDPLCGAEARNDEFLGWFTEDGTQITPEMTADEDRTVKALWKSDLEPPEEEEPDEPDEPDEDEPEEDEPDESEEDPEEDESSEDEDGSGEEAE